MNDELFRMLSMVAVFNLPTVVIVFAVAWFATGFLPSPKPSWKHGALACVSAWVASTLIAPFVSRSVQDYMDKGAAPAIVTTLVVAGVILVGLPRLNRKSI